MKKPSKNNSVPIWSIALVGLAVVMSHAATYNFAAVADSYTSEANPSDNYGEVAFLNMRDSSSSDFNGYLKFDLSTLQNHPVTAAELYLYCWNGAHNLRVLDLSDDNWTEFGITYNNAPATGSLIEQRSVGDEVWEAFDVFETSEISGTHSFVLSTTGSSFRRIDSKEGANGSYLSVMFSNASPSFITPSLTAADATIFAPYSGSIAGSASDPEGDELLYSKSGGPSWLNVASDGSLSGVPTGSDTGLNSFSILVTDTFGAADSATLEIIGVEGGGRVAWSDDFESGSGLLGSINGWTEQGPEDKAYNMAGSGQLVIQEANGDEKGNGIHAGFFDTVYSAMNGAVGLQNEGDWICLSLDFDLFSGTYGGASIADDSAGLRISMAKAGRTNNAGYGLYIATGANTTHTWQEMGKEAAAQMVIASALSGVDIPEDSGPKNLIIILSRVDGGVVLGGSLDGHALEEATNTNAAIFETLFDTLTFSVASRDHGLRIDNVEITVPETSSLWNQFVYAKVNDIEPTLPDFSYAGYGHGEEPIPTVDWPVFNVTNYGAVADDGLSDKAAIKTAIAAAEANGSGIIFFPPGRFEINKPETPWVNDIIKVEGSRIVFRGSGRGAGGTELYGERHMDPTDPSKLWTCPNMIQFKGYGDRPGTASAVVTDAARETFSVTVANATIFSVGEWVQLTRDDNSTAAVAEAVAPYAVDPTWVNIINDGVQIRELHLITGITGNQITFKTPIHAEVSSTGNWSVVLYDPLVEVGVEDMAFTGGWVSNFVHHASFYDDSGWSALSFANVANSWIRNCRFTDWSTCVSVAGSANVTVSDIKLDGNKGHSALTFNNSSHCMAFNLDDTAGHHHACGVAGRCSGNVFLKCNYNDDTCYESHASQPRHTLFDTISGGWKYGRWGGAQGSQPNHLENLVFWNYENIGAGEPGLFEFMRSGSIYGRIIMPYVIGFHGNPQAFDTSMIKVLESNGTAVKPDSLYEAQYQLRTGKTFSGLHFNEWAAGYGLSGSDAESDADPDIDFRDNLFEFGVGGIPTVGSNSPSEVPEFGRVDKPGPSEFEYIYTRRRNADRLGLHYEVEFTDDLTTNDWSTVGVTETGSVWVDDDFESVTNRVFTTGTTNGYVRLKVEISD